MPVKKKATTISKTKDTTKTTPTLSKIEISKLFKLCKRKKLNAVEKKS